MTLAKAAIAILIWALFYLVIAFAIAIGFGAGWRLVTGQPVALKFPSFRRKEVGGNGARPDTAVAVPAAAAQ